MKQFSRRSTGRAPRLHLVLVAFLVVALAGCLSIPAKSTHEVDVNVSGVQPAAGPPAASTGSRSLVGPSVSNFSAIDVSGNANVGGDLTVTGAVSANGSITDSGQLAMKGIAIKPTAASTATPALLINNSSVAANDAIMAQLVGTPVFRVGNGGDTLVGGALSVTGASSNGGLAIAATAQATATPAAYINNKAAVNADSLVIANAATPVFKVSKTGLISGYVLRYASSGQAIICNTTTVTGTATLAHGLATPSVVIVNMGADATGDHARVSFTNAAGTVVAKVWSSALTPAPAATGVPVDWCVIGTP